MHYAEISERVSSSFWNELDAVLESIERNPRSHHYDSCGLRRAKMKRFPYHLLHEIEIIEIDGVAVDSLLKGSDSAGSAADLDFPASSADEVHNHPQFLAFVMENRDRQYLVDGRIEIEFSEWQSLRKRLAEHAGTSNSG